MTMRISTKIIATMTMMVSMLILISLAPSPLIAAEAQTATVPTTIFDNSDTANSTSSRIDLSQQPVLQEQTRVVTETPINQAHTSVTFTGNGTLTFSNNNINTTVNFISNGSALISFLTESVQGTETIRTEDGTTATLTFYEIVKFNPAAREGEGIIIAEVNTSPSGPLAPLSGTILAGIDDIQPNGESNVTLWEWETRISDLAILPL
jgi:hypothetical protein